VFASRVADTVVISDALSGKVQARLPAAPHGRPVFHPRGVQLAAVAPDDRTIRLFDSKTWKPVADLAGHRNRVAALAFAPDGKTLASADDSAILWWDLGSRKHTVLFQLATPRDVLALAISPAGPLLAAGWSDGTVRLFGHATGEVLHTLGNSAAKALALAFSPGGNFLAVARHVPPADKDRPHQVDLSLWDTATGQQVKTLPAPAAEIVNVGFSLDGRQLFGASREGGLRIWDLRTAQVVHSLRSTGAFLT